MQQLPQSSQLLGKGVIVALGIWVTVVLLVAPGVQAKPQYSSKFMSFYQTPNTRLAGQGVLGPCQVCHTFNPNPPLFESPNSNNLNLYGIDIRTKLRDLGIPSTVTASDQQLETILLALNPENSDKSVLFSSNQDEIKAQSYPGLSNDEPAIANASAPQTTVLLPVGATTTMVTLDGRASTTTNAGATVTGYTWSGTPDPDDVVQPTVTLGAGVHTFTLVVKDSAGVSSVPDKPASVTITVQPHLPPVAVAGASQTTVLLPAGTPTATITLNGSNSTATGATVTGYTWSGTPDPADVVMPMVTLGEGVHTFTLVVTDSLGASSSPPPPA
jgi:hypothetical protein